MSGHEPTSGWNLPPGCYEGSRDAPWNAPEPRTCGMCEHLLEGCCDYGTCDLEFREAFEAEHLRTLWDAARWAREFEPELRALYAERLGEEGFHPVDGGAE